MKQLFRHAQAIASEISDAIVLFSTGKDSIAMLDLACRYMDRARLVVVHLYFVPGLSWRETIFRHYEKRYGIKIYQFPQVDVSKIIKAHDLTQQHVKTLRQPDIEAFLRREFNISWLLYGYKKADSLSRRGMLSIIDGIDYRHKKAYPVSDWSEKDVFNYCKRERLPLPADYNSGFRDINTFKGASLDWLYNNFPADYERVKAVYPFVEADRMRRHG